MNFYKRYKLAYRGNIPLMDDKDDLEDPYREKNPYQSGSKGRPLTTMGDEETSGSVGGTRARGATFPEFSSVDDLEQQRDRDIPTSEHMFIGDDGQAPIGEGANDDRFEDNREGIVDIYKYRNPIGPHNMQRYRTVIDRTRESVQGV